MPDKSNPSYNHKPNHEICKETGFVYSPGVLSTFTPQAKLKFLELYKANGLAIWRTCRSLGMSVETVHRHLQTDPKFKELFDEARQEYIDNVESTSRFCALDPKNYVERFFQLKALLPETYGEGKIARPMEITLNIDFGGLSKEHERTHSIDAEIVQELEQATPLPIPPPTDTGHNEGHALDGK